MKIKYTSSYDQIQLFLFKENCFPSFRRNEWKEVPDHVAKVILKDNANFYCEADFIFDTKEFLNNRLNICISRFGALGDLIQLIPIMKYFKDNSKSIFTLATSKQYVSVFKTQTHLFDNVIENSNLRKSEFDKVIMLDGVLESDHNLSNEEHLIHRVKLYEKFFGVTIETYDFSMKIEDKDILVAMELLNASLV